MSTAGSTGTIGWAGPWVSTHRRGGVDRMYPAHLRTDVGSSEASARAAPQPPTCQWNYRAAAPPKAAPDAGVPVAAAQHALGRLRGHDEQQRDVHLKASPKRAVTEQPADGGASTGAQRPVGTPIERLSALRLKSRQGPRRTQGRENAQALAEAPRTAAPQQQSAPRLPAKARRAVQRPQWCADTNFAASTDSEGSPERAPTKVALQQTVRPRGKATTERRRDDAVAGSLRVSAPAQRAAESFDELPAVAAGRTAPLDAHAAPGVDPGGEACVLQRCPTCSRTFRPEALAKHAAVCSKVFAQKRRAFDSKSMRTPEGADTVALAGRAPAGRRQRRAPTAAPLRHEDCPAQGALGKASSWKQKSEMFRAAMRANRSTALLVCRRRTAIVCFGCVFQCVVAAPLLACACRSNDCDARIVCQQCNVPMEIAHAGTSAPQRRAGRTSRSCPYSKASTTTAFHARTAAAALLPSPPNATYPRCAAGQAPGYICTAPAVRTPPSLPFPDQRPSARTAQS